MSTEKVLELGTIYHEVCEDAHLSGLSEDNRVKVALSLFIQANDKRGERWTRTRAALAPQQGEQTYTGAFLGRMAEDYMTKKGTPTKKYVFKVGDRAFTMYGKPGQMVAESTRGISKNDKVVVTFEVNGQFTNLKSISKAQTDDLEQGEDDIPFD